MISLNKEKFENYYLSQLFKFEISSHFNLDISKPFTTPLPMNFVNEQRTETQSSIMKSFGIADIERLSGVRAHTLRTWEQRYGIPAPKRFRNGIRKYSLDEARRILLMALLNQYGFKISQLIPLSEEDIINRLQNFNDDDCSHQLAVKQLLFSMYAMDIEGFEKQLNLCFLKWPDYAVICNIIDPFLKYSRLLWQGNRLPEEHLVVTILRKKLFYCIEKLAIAIKPKKATLLFLNDTRQLDLSLLYACYLLRHAETSVVYMGNDVSIENLSDIFASQQPDFLYTYLPEKNNFDFQKLSSIMNEKLPGGKLMVTLQTDVEINNTLPGNIVITSFTKAMEIITS